MKVEVPALGSPSLISLVVSVDVKQHRNENEGTDDTRGTAVSQQQIGIAFCSVHLICLCDLPSSRPWMCVGVDMGGGGWVFVCVRACVYNIIIHNI